MVMLSLIILIVLLIADGGYSNPLWITLLAALLVTP